MFVCLPFEARPVTLSYQSYFSEEKLTGVHHTDVHTLLSFVLYPLLTPVDIVIVDQGRVLSEQSRLCGARPQAFFFCYVTAVVSIFLDLSHSRSVVHDPPVIETAAPVDSRASRRATTDSAGTHR